MWTTFQYFWLSCNKQVVNELVHFCDLVYVSVFLCVRLSCAGSEQEVQL